MNQSKLSWFISIVGLLLVCALIWFVGPLVTIGGVTPLESDFSRAIAIFVVIVLWLLNVVRKVVVASRANNQLAMGMVAPVAEEPERGGFDDDQVRSAEEVAALRERFDEALRILKQTKSKGAGNLYELPWYIIIGPPGSGKTTALRNSGLQFPLEERFGKDAIKGVGGTRNCDWWFTNEAVLVDTAGRYVTQDSDRNADSAAWEGFMRLLKRHRRRRPINGVLVTISLSDLLLQSEAERDGHVAAIRARVQELYDYFGLRFPIYVLFSKCDLVAGFMEFFDDLGREERSQVWGMTFPLEEETPVDRMAEEFDALLGRLNDRLLWRMDTERDSARRALIYSLPQQMATLRDVAVRFVQDTFRATRYDEAPLVRGVYFTSGTQEGTPIDRIMGAVARSFGIDYRSVASTGDRGRSYFITDLLRGVIFPESDLVGTNKKLERQRAWLQRGAYALAFLLTVGTISAWVASYTQNVNQVKQMQERIAAYNEEAEEIPEPVEGIHQLLLALESLQRTTEVYARASEQVPWYEDLGMYQGDKLGGAAREAYLRELRGSFITLVALSIAQRINTGSDDPEFLYTGLKTYLMLSLPDHFESELLTEWMSLEWQRSYRDDPKVQDQLHAHLENLIEAGLQPSPLVLDQPIIDAVRRRLTQVPLHQLLYGQLLRNAGSPGDDPFRPIDAMGSAADKVFRRASGKSLEEPIAEIFTYNGYYKSYLKDSRTLLSNFREESWVLGIEQSELGERELAELDGKLDELYAADYARTWRKLLEDLQIVPFRTMQQSVGVLEVLSGRRSPLRGLLRAVNKNTTLSVLPGGVGAAASKVDGGVLGAGRSKLANLFGTQDDGTSTGPRSVPEIVDPQFADLNALTAVEKEGDEASIEELIALLGKVYAHLDAVAAGEDSPGLVLRRLNSEAVGQPEPVKAWLRKLSLSTTSISDQKQAADQATALQEARKDLLVKINRAWLGKVLPMCERAMVDRYPIYKNARKEMTIKDFGQLFSPGGLVDGFFSEHLLPFVDTSGQHWRWRESEGVSLGLGPSLLRPFKIAADIRDTFFAGGSVPSVEFAMKASRMDNALTQFNLDLEGQKFIYRHGPSRAKKAVWPNPGGTLEVRMFFEDRSGARKTKVGDGPWAWFRFLDEARLERVTAEKIFATFESQGREVRYEIIANSVINPFMMQELAEFRCPKRF